MRIFRDILNMIYPQYCIGCNALLNAQETICIKCLNELPYTDFFTTDNNPVKEIFYGRMNVEHAGSLLFYTKDSLTQRLVFDLKYRHNKTAGKFLGYLLAKALKQTVWIKDIDLLVPMPLHKQKERKRGYNQAAIIASEMATQLNIPMNENVVAKSIHTETQTHKTREARWQSMQNVFQVNDAKSLYGKYVLLIDDVLTTGATMEVCGNELLKINNTKLSVATAAYAL